MTTTTKDDNKTVAASTTTDKVDSKVKKPRAAVAKSTTGSKPTARTGATKSSSHTPAKHEHVADKAVTVTTTGRRSKPTTATTSPLSDLKSAVREAEAVSNDTVESVANEPVVRVRKVDDFGRSYATGKRKNAIARVWIKAGSGKITVNGRDVAVYFARPVLQMIVNQPFTVADRATQFDVECLVNGGGLSGQAGAVKHGISKALTLFEPDLRAPLKAAKFLRRDSRVVERKKYGRAKARRRFQFSKR